MIAENFPAHVSLCKMNVEGTENSWADFGTGGTCKSIMETRHGIPYGLECMILYMLIRNVLNILCLSTCSVI